MGAGITAVEGASTGYLHLLDPRRTWYSDWRLITLHWWLFLYIITSYTNGYDGSMMNGLQSLSQWESSFNSPNGSLLGVINACQFIGQLPALLFAPYLSDWVGRRIAVIFGAVIMCGGVALQTASTDIGMFIGARCLIGFGLAFAQNAAPMMVSELSYPPYRATMTSLYNSLWYSGSIVAAWTTFGSFRIANSWAWRLPSILQCLSSVLQVLFCFFSPESPRWLISNGREVQALKTLAYYHAGGNEQDPLVVYEFEEIKAAIELDRTVSANVGWKSLFTTKGNLKRVRIIVAIAFFSQWSGNGLVSYYLNKVLDLIGVTDNNTQLIINGCLQIWNLIVAVTAAFLVERAGRRVLFITSCIGMLIFFTAQTICTAVFVEYGNKASANAVIAFIFLYYGAFDIAFTPLIVAYCIEILPYNVRAKGFNIFNFSVALSLIFNQYVNPVALSAISWKYYIVYICWIAFELVFLWRYVIETKNRTLEETAAIFDGEELTEEIARNAASTTGIKDVREIITDEKSSSEYVPTHNLGKA